MVQHSAALDTTFHALADPTRRAIVERLAAGEHDVSALAEPFDMTLTAVQKHLHVLERAGLVACEKRGRVRYCRLDPRGLGPAARWIEDRRHLWQSRLNHLNRHLAADAEQGASR